MYKRKNVPKNIEEAFWFKVTKTKGCWNWIASTCGNRFKIGKGYGHFRFKNKVYSAHRFSYQLHKGSIPEKTDVLHSCDNTKCVNPSHLWLGTAQDNVNDMIKKGRDNFMGHARLSEKDVIDIRIRKKMGEKSMKLAREYGINYKHIWQIVNFKRWRHIISPKAK